MKTIPFFRSSTPLTPAERLAKRHLVFKDTLALLSVFAVTCVLAVLTWLIFRSYSLHQKDAAVRWKRRGEEALVHSNPAAAVYDLRTSLGYEPDHRDTQLELAKALAQMGTPRSMQEAAVYFNALWEKEPGDGFHPPFSRTRHTLCGDRYAPTSSCHDGDTIEFLESGLSAPNEIERGGADEAHS